MGKKAVVLFSGGKDSVYATYLAKKEGYSIECLVCIESSNKHSYMFHTPSITKTKKQAEVMNLPLIIQKTKGEKEMELKELKKAILKAKKEYEIEVVVTGAIKSVYQSSRIQNICSELNLECINPLWQKNEEEYLQELIKNNFKVILVGVFAYPFNENWLLREIDEKFLLEISELNKKFGINVAGEGGEFESFVLNCPLYSRELKLIDCDVVGEGENSYRAEIKIE